MLGTLSQSSSNSVRFETLSSGDELPNKVGQAFVAGFQAVLGDLSIFDLFPVLGMCEDKLLEPQAAFGYKLRLTKKHLPQHKDYHRRPQTSRGKDSHNYRDFSPKCERKDQRDEDRGRHIRGYSKDRDYRVKGKHNHGSGYPDYYIKKEDKPKDSPEEDKKVREEKNSKGNSQNRKDSDDFAWVPKQQPKANDHKVASSCEEHQLSKTEAEE